MRAMVTALLMLAAASASAEWAKVAGSGDSVYYVDPASITRSGNFLRVWAIEDYAKQEPNGTRSRRLLFEIDCAGERLRRVAASEHAEPMAAGKTLNASDSTSDWIYVAPITGTNIPWRTPYRAILRSVCYR
jgi:hypothetical protein